MPKLRTKLSLPMHRTWPGLVRNPICCGITNVIGQYSYDDRMPPARTPRRRRGSGSWLSGNCGHAAARAARDVLPGHPLALHIDDFLTDLANANRPRKTIRAYRGDLTGFADHHDGEIAGS